MLWMAKYVFYINFNCTFRYPEMEKHFECQPESVVTPLFMKLILELAGCADERKKHNEIVLCGKGTTIMLQWNSWM